MTAQVNPSKKPSHILIVDDDGVVRDFYNHLLSRNGYHVLQAESAEDALLLLEKQTFDLVLLDLCMPGMGGMEFLRILRKQDSLPEVLIVSGYATLEDAVEAGKLGVFGVLEKVCPPQKLLAQIEKILDIHKEPLISYIQSHFPEIESCKDVAAFFHIDPRTASNRIKRATNQTCREFLESCRIQEAQRLLAESELEAKEIAAKVGYRSYHTFSHAFQKLTGHTPRQYRREVRSA